MNELMSETGFFPIADAYPHREALVDELGQTVSYSELAASAHRIAIGLQSLGLTSGDCVVVLMDNSVDFVSTYLACMEIGLYVAPVNWHLTAPEIAYILVDSDAKAFVADERFAEAACHAAASAQVAHCISSGTIPGFVPLASVGASSTAEQRPHHRTLGGPMLYTSGTTGKPKGVKRPLTGANPDELSPAHERFFAGFGLSGSDNVHICGSPLYHTAVVNFVVISLHHGHKVVLMNKWAPVRMLQLIQEHKVTQSHMVPTQFSRLLELDRQVRETYDVSSLRTVIHGAAPCPRHVKEEMLAWWGPILTEYYAGTEGGGTTITGQQWLEKPGSVGLPWASTVLCILDDHGTEVPAGQVGNIYLQMRGSTFAYHGDRDKTSASFVGDMFTMGDIGYVDEDGFLFLCDRKNDMIISGGVNIYPAEIESELQRHPAVFDAAVFGIPHPDWGEEVKAVIEIAPSFSRGSKTDAELVDDILADLSSRIAKYKLPKSIDIAAQLPREENGKLYKRKLKDPYWQQ